MPIQAQPGQAQPLPGEAYGAELEGHDELLDEGQATGVSNRTQTPTVYVPTISGAQTSYTQAAPAFHQRGALLARRRSVMVVIPHRRHRCSQQQAAELTAALLLVLPISELLSSRAAPGLAGTHGGLRGGSGGLQV
jgi:hypothetical protein